MKRKPKPFSVEIKKSRAHGQRHQLAPRRLFALTPARAPTIVQKEEPQAIVQPAATPRILPSILEPVWSSSEVVEPIWRKSSARSPVPEDQIQESESTTTKPRKPRKKTSKIVELMTVAEPGIASETQGVE